VVYVIYNKLREKQNFFRRGKMKILVCVDGSKDSQEAFTWSKRLSQCSTENEILILYVFHMPSSMEVVPLSDSELDSIANNSAESIFSELSDQEIPNTKITKIVKIGDPAQTILDIADDYNVDFICMGSRGLSGIKKLLIGSVSDKVLTYSSRPVFLTKLPRKTNILEEMVELP
jgi:nucleotide-binding universal stress UspA family protein